MIGFARDLARQSGDRTQQTHETEATKGRIVAIVASVAWATDRRGSEGSAGGTVTQSSEPTAQLPAAEPVASQGLNRRFWRLLPRSRECPRPPATSSGHRRGRSDASVRSVGFVGRKWHTTGSGQQTVGERLLLPTTETRLEGRGGGYCLPVGSHTRLRGPRARSETGGPSPRRAACLSLIHISEPTRL